MRHHKMPTVNSDFSASFPSSGIHCWLLYLSKGLHCLMTRCARCDRQTDFVTERVELVRAASGPVQQLRFPFCGSQMALALRRGSRLPYSRQPSAKFPMTTGVIWGAYQSISKLRVQRPVASPHFSRPCLLIVLLFPIEHPSRLTTSASQLAVCARRRYRGCAARIRCRSETLLC
ncbi:hypothetical protein BKA93DRAFT_507426 [Sparassis latifolia]